MAHIGAGQESLYLNFLGCESELIFEKRIWYKLNEK